MDIFAQQALKIISIILAHSELTSLQEGYLMLHNAEPALKVHSVKTIKLCSLRNVPWEVTATCKVPSNPITTIQQSASFVNNACLEVNARPKVQFTHRDALQEPIALMDLISVSLALKVSTVVK